MDQGELTLASQLKAPVRSITLFDRAYFSADFWWCFKKYAEKNNMAFDKIEV